MKWRKRIKSLLHHLKNKTTNKERDGIIQILQIRNEKEMKNCQISIFKGSYIILILDGKI